LRVTSRYSTMFDDDHGSLLMAPAFDSGDNLHPKHAGYWRWLMQSRCPC
jgi:hypothetical protein